MTHVRLWWSYPAGVYPILMSLEAYKYCKRKWLRAAFRYSDDVTHHVAYYTVETNKTAAGQTLVIITARDEIDQDVRTWVHRTGAYYV
jgi:hypothetical protein